MAVFWVVSLCSLEKFTDVSEVLSASIIRAMSAMEAASTSETLGNIYQTTRRYKPEDSHLYTRRRENLRSYLILVKISPLISQLGISYPVPRWQLQCLPKRWIIFNIRRGSSLKAEVVLNASRENLRTIISRLVKMLH
jgi:hypothetical protein